jgi:riboflavin biosynthesis pyrimidine reductase
VKLRRLLPEPGLIDGVEAVAGLAGATRFVVNMVESADGRAAHQGKTAPLSDPADRELFHLLRTRADAILVGIGTLRAERYGPLIKNERLRELRLQAGLRPDPIGVTLTHTLDLPYDIPLFQDPEARFVAYTTSDREPEPCPAQLEVVRLPELDPRLALEDLRARHGVRCVVGEGGPHLNAPLFAAGVVDELFLTIAPVLVGGHDPLTILAGELPAPLGLELRQVLEHESTLLLRYAVRPSG